MSVKSAINALLDLTVLHLPSTNTINYCVIKHNTANLFIFN